MEILPHEKLHDIAVRISAPLDRHVDVPTDAGTSVKNILHVSGTPFKSKATGYLGDSIEQLRRFQLSRIGNRVDCSWGEVLGQGGYGTVYYGRVFSLQLVGEKLASHVNCAWNTIKPLFTPATVLLPNNAFQFLSAASKSCVAMLWQMMMKTAESWGISKPCAIKVLCDKGPSRGVYGSRSIEYEVVTTLHVSSVCSDCPFIGRAYGFDLALHSYLCEDDSARSKSVASHPRRVPSDDGAVLLVMEAYITDLNCYLEYHQQHSDSLEFPCAKCWDRIQRQGGDPCATFNAPFSTSSVTSDTIHALVAPLSVASSTARLLLQSAMTSSKSQENELEFSQHVSPRALDAKPTAQGQVVSLWDYTRQIRLAGLVISTQEVLRIAIQLAEALRALHEVANVIHLDVKPHNVLLDSKLQVKLLDFGLSAAFKKDRPFISLRQCRGTRPYTAPEMCPWSSGLVGPPADIYSFGCTILAICINGCNCGKISEDGTPTSFELLKKESTCDTDLSPFAPKQLQSVIKACLHECASERPNASELLSQLRDIDASGCCKSSACSHPCCKVSEEHGLRISSCDDSSIDVRLHPDRLVGLDSTEIPPRFSSSSGEQSLVSEVSQVCTISDHDCDMDPTSSRVHPSDFSRSRGHRVHHRSIMHRVPFKSVAMDGSASAASGGKLRRTGCDTVSGASAAKTLGAFCRPMPHTKSVRVGLASIMRPVSAQSSSVSGLCSEGSTSMSFANIPTYSMA